MLEADDPLADFLAWIRPAWHRDALCREPEYRELEWFPERGTNMAPMRAVCGRCLVRAECESAGLDEQSGIWGGVAEGGRRKARSAAASAKAAERDAA